MTTDKTVDPHEFGARGDGVANDTQAIQAAIDFCRANRRATLTLRQGHAYVIDEPLRIHFSDFDMEGNGATLRWINQGKPTGNLVDGHRFRHHGMLSIAGAVAPGDLKLMRGFTNKLATDAGYVSRVYLDNAASFQAGDYVHIGRPYLSENTVLLNGDCVGNCPSNGRQEYIAGFDIVAKIIDTSGDSVSVDYHSPFDFSGVDFTQYFATKVEMVRNVSIRNLVLDDAVPWKSPAIGSNGPNPGQVVSGIGVIYGADIRIENIEARNTKFPVVMVQYGHGITSRNIRLEGAAYTGGGEGYVTHYCGVQHGLVEDVSGIRCRHVTDFSYSAFCTLRRMRECSSFFYDFDLHGIWEHNITVENLAGNVQIGNGWAHFPMMDSDIVFRDCELSSFVVQGHVFNLQFVNCSVNLGFPVRGRGPDSRLTYVCPVCPTSAEWRKLVPAHAESLNAWAWVPGGWERPLGEGEPTA